MKSQNEELYTIFTRNYGPLSDVFPGGFVIINYQSDSKWQDFAYLGRQYFDVKKVSVKESGDSDKNISEIAITADIAVGAVDGRAYTNSTMYGKINLNEPYELRKIGRSSVVAPDQEKGVLAIMTISTDDTGTVLAFGYAAERYVKYGGL